MILKSIKYSEYDNAPGAWHLENFDLEKINLIVGKNAVGKTRTLNVIGALADLVASDKAAFDEGFFEAVFLNEFSEQIELTIHFNNSKVIKEKLKIGDNVLLERGVGGIGTIFAKQLKKNIQFQLGDNELACVKKRDAIQHPFLENLFEWGKSARFFRFGYGLGKTHFQLLNDSKIGELNLKQTINVNAILKDGISKYKDDFTKKIIKDMKSLNYDISNIYIENIPNIAVSVSNIENIEQLQGVCIEEKGINKKLFQLDLSDGMFRALSLIIQLNYSILEGFNNLILVDDIGEGLDFERSTSLIKTLIDKAKKSNMQLLMSTNDRFVMNNVPLKYWSVLQRKNNICKVLNYSNSKEKFDEFNFTGLSNFDLLSTDFLA